MKKKGDQFRFELPLRAEGVTLVRLVAAGIAGHASFSMDEVEDLKIGVSEGLNFFLTRISSRQGKNVVMEASLEEEGLRVKLFVEGVFLKESWRGEEEGGRGPKANISSHFILKNVVDDVSFLETEHGSEIHFYKGWRDANRVTAG